MSFKVLTCLSSMTLALAACGGGNSSPEPAAEPEVVTTAPGGLHVGYYQEDPVTNPEDPTAGAFVLNLPDGNGPFSGGMYFSYVGCQTSNAGIVSGTKTDQTLSGTWSGTVDGTAQSGSYSGRYDPTTRAYSGTFVNAGGKQYRDLRPCIEYFIAPNGSFEMFPVESRVPADFSVTASGGAISWGAVTGAATTLVYVLDPAIAQTSGNPVLWQTVVSASARSVAIPSSATLQPGKQYIAVVAVAGGSQQRLAFGSQRFAAP